MLEYKDLFPEQKELDIEKILVLYNREKLIRAPDFITFLRHYIAQNENQ